MSDLILKAPPARLCVVRLSAIGDTCHALAVVRRIQDGWPATDITWIIGKTEASLLADIAGIEFIIFDKSDGRRAYRKVQQQLAGRSFDVALCMHASMRANFLCRKIAAPIRLGFDRARAKDFQWLFTNQRIAAAKGQHALEAMMSFATAIGVPPQPIRWDVPIDDEAREFAAGFKNPGRPLVAISPCSSQRSRNYRNWSIENFTAVISHMKRLGCDVVISGGRSDLEIEYGTALSAKGSAENVVARTSLKQLAALIEASDLLICPDSGPAHIATTCGTPVLGLYATSNPDRTGPFAARELTVNRYPDAARKYLGKAVEQLRWGQRIRHPDAMNLITIKDVTDKIDGFFSI